MKKSFFIKVFVLTIFLLSSAMAYAAKAPTDISKHWAKDAINSANSEGWAYIENGKFNPDKPATREEVAWMLVGACKTVQFDGFDINQKADLSKFKDKPSAWASSRMAIAIGNKLIGGYPDKTIKPKASITRAELAVLLSRLIKGNPPARFLPFWDYIPKWATDGIKKAYGKDIIKGYANNSFKANASVTKAEALVMIQRCKTKQPSLPVPACEEFQKIAKTLKGTEIIDHNAMLLYYGQNGKTTRGQKENFYILHHEDESFTVVLRDFKDETYKDLQTALGIILPASAGKLITEVKNMSDVNAKQITLDNKKIGIYVFPAYITISIGK